MSTHRGLLLCEEWQPRFYNLQFTVMITKVLKSFLIVAVCIVSNCYAADYVDDINLAAGKRAEGQRVIYEMNVGSFTTEGTFAAAQERLDELKALGIDIVWLMPIYPRGGGINSPYAATNFKKPILSMAPSPS